MVCILIILTIFSITCCFLEFIYGIQESFNTNIQYHFLQQQKAFRLRFGFNTHLRGIQTKSEFEIYICIQEIFKTNV